MTLPVTLPPLGAVLMASAAAGPRGRNLFVTRWWMRLLTVMGFAGSALHAYGVSGATELCRLGARRPRCPRLDG